MHEDLKAYWGENGAVPGSVMQRTVDAGHGRIETRTVRVCNQVEGIQHDHDWPGLKAVAMVSSVREFKAAHDDRPPSQSVRYCIMSHERSARTTAAIVRSHWGVENQLHWVLDVVFNEDQSRNRCDNAPANLSLMREFALNTLRKEPSTISVRRKRLKAARNHDYLRCAHCLPSAYKSNAIALGGGGGGESAQRELLSMNQPTSILLTITLKNTLKSP